MGVEPSAKETFTRADVDEAINKLTEADLNKLQSIAGLYGRSVEGQTPSDLLQTAIERTLLETRKWPKGIDFVQHLRLAMKSIASGWRKQSHRRAARVPLIQDSDSNDGSSESLPSIDSKPARSLTLRPESSVEDQVEAGAIIAYLTEFFREKGATTEMELVDGFLSGYSQTELRDVLSLEQQKYESAMKRIRRTAAKFWLEGT